MYIFFKYLYIKMPAQLVLIIESLENKNKKSISYKYIVAWQWYKEDIYYV